ncbi:MAG: hypothetical protein K9I94_10270 [Bacteroidales bacterium]|nr:hypothetical protein [Bacteroidales bacterium]
MGIIEKLRTLAGMYYLKKDITTLKRNKAVSNIAEAKSIALVFYLEDDIHFQSVEKLAEDFRNSGKNVNMYGIFRGSEIPSYFYPSINRQLITKKDINWYMKPVGKKVNGYFNREFDILIDLSRISWLPVTWLVALSKARMKVGRYDESMKQYYDLMIGNEIINDIDEWFDQIIHYLNIIKSQETK